VGYKGKKKFQGIMEKGKGVEKLPKHGRRPFEDVQTRAPPEKSANRYPPKAQTRYSKKGFKERRPTPSPQRRKKPKKPTFASTKIRIIEDLWKRSI